MGQCRGGAAAAALLLLPLLLPVCRAGRVFFPGPSIGPAPPALWQSLHALRQARRLDGGDDGAAELRAAGVLIGQKYSDLEQLQGPEQQNSGLQSFQVGELGPQQDSDLQTLQVGELAPLEPLDQLGQLDGQQGGHLEPLRVRDPELPQDSEPLQSLAPLPFLLAVEPRGAELSSEAQLADPDPRGFNSFTSFDRQEHPNPASFSAAVSGITLDFEDSSDDPRGFNSFTSFDGQEHSNPASFSAPVPGITLDFEDSSDDPRGFDSYTSFDGQEHSNPASFSTPVPEITLDFEDSSDNPRGFDSFDSFDRQEHSNPDSFSAPVPGITLDFDNTSDDTETVVVAGPVPEDVVYAADTAGSDSTGGLLSGELSLPGRGPPRLLRQDLQSSASSRDPTAVLRPEPAPSAGRPQQPRNPGQYRLTTAAAPSRPDQNLVNLLVTQGVLRPAGGVRIARLQLLTDGEEAAETERPVFFSPAGSDEGEVEVEVDVSSEPSEVVLSEFRDEPTEATPSELRDEEVEQAVFPSDDDELQTLTATDGERERVLNTNIVPIAAEKDVFGQLITPRAARTGTVSGAGAAVPDASDSSEESASGGDELQRPVVTPRAASLAARLTELGSRVSRQGVWGRRTSSAAPTALRRLTEAARSGPPVDGQRRLDVEEDNLAAPVFVDNDVDGGEAGLDADGSVRQEAAAQGTAEVTRTDIHPAHTANFGTDNDIEDDDDTGLPELVGEMENCPKIGGNITLECRIKNAPKHEEIKRFWWMKRHFDGDDRLVQDKLLAINGMSLNTANNTSVHQVTAAHQRLVVTTVAAADTGLYMCQAGWGDSLQEVEMLVFLCH